MLDFESEVSVMSQLSTNHLLVRMYGAVDTRYPPYKKINVVSVDSKVKYTISDTPQSNSCWEQQRIVVMGRGHTHLNLQCLYVCIYVFFDSAAEYCDGTLHDVLNKTWTWDGRCNNVFCDDFMEHFCNSKAGATATILNILIQIAKGNQPFSIVFLHLGLCLSDFVLCVTTSI